MIHEELKLKAKWWINYLYNEGVIEFDDAHINAYAKGTMLPHYAEIRKDVEAEYQLTTEKLPYYDVKETIDAAIKEFATEANCEMLALPTALYDLNDAYNKVEENYDLSVLGKDAQRKFQEVGKTLTEICITSDLKL